MQANASAGTKETGGVFELIAASAASLGQADGFKSSAGLTCSSFTELPTELGFFANHFSRFPFGFYPVDLQSLTYENASPVFCIVLDIQPDGATPGH